jgi:glycosyltransferase involved in cell wall biosynthesis
MTTPGGLRATVSVVVPTRNRPDQAAACVESILLCDDADFTISVVDQSDDTTTRDLIEAIDDPRVRHVPTDTTGASAARNVGMEATDGAVIAYTDDDCRVDPHWIRVFRDLFEDPSTAMVFGAVVKGDTTDPSASAAEFEPRGTVTYQSLPPVSEPWGISASVAIRRSVLEVLGGFDTRLGPGAPINTGGEDSDLLIRVVAAGHRVAATDTSTVTHLGFRTGDEASSLYRGYAFALGAVFMKHLRLGTRPGREQLHRWLIHFARETVVNTVRRRHPSGAGFMLGLVKGAVHAIRIPIDPRSGHFA